MVLHPVHRFILKIMFKMMDRMVLHPVNRFILKIVFKMMDRMVLHPVHRFILKIMFKMMDRMVLHPVNRFILKIMFKMRGRACGVLRAGGVFLCGFASEKMPTAPIERAFGACLRSREAAKRECFGCFAGLLSALGGGYRDAVFITVDPLVRGIKGSDDFGHRTLVLGKSPINTLKKYVILQKKRQHPFNTTQHGKNSHCGRREQHPPHPAGDTGIRKV
jgi:hypothetical protein